MHPLGLKNEQDVDVLREVLGRVLFPLDSGRRGNPFGSEWPRRPHSSGSLAGSCFPPATGKRRRTGYFTWLAKRAPTIFYVDIWSRSLELEVYEEAISAEAPLGLSIGQVRLK